MHYHNSKTVSWFIATAGMVLSFLLTGCGGGEFGSELAMRPTPRALGAAVLRLPADESFSITLAPTQETPGLGGQAEADASAAKNGAAEAVARVDNGGSAMAGFQLGHSMKNDADRMVYLHVRVACDYQTDAGAAPPSTMPEAQVGLNLYARDGRNRLLRSFNLAQHSTETGAVASKDSKVIEFTLPLGAREWVNIFVAGRARIETTEGHEAHGSIKLNKLEMTIEKETAPPVKTAADE